MKTRIISAITLAPLLVIIVILGGNILKYSLLVLSIIALSEFFKAIDSEHKTYHNFSYVFTIIYYIALDNTALTNYYSFNLMFIGFIIVFILSLFFYLVLKYPKVNINNISTTMLATIYISIFFSFIYAVRQNSFVDVWFIFITAFATDIFAYFSGVFLGKNKLIPHLSPNKTVEGAIGGTLGSIFTCVLYTLIIIFFANNQIYSGTTINVFLSILVGLLCSISAQFGDLTASSIKRLTGVKDFGNIIPGHGGILDRFDSILFTAPVLYVFIMFLR